MQACTLAFLAKTGGTGTQTVTGVQDADGNPFEGKLFLFHGSSELNTLAGDVFSFGGGFRRNHGFDDGGAHTYGQATADIYTFSLKIVDTGASSSASLVCEQAQLAFGGRIMRLAHVSAIRSGEFDLLYSLNDIDGDAASVTILGGDDLDVAVGGCVGGVNTTGFLSEAVILKEQTQFGGTATGTGGGATGYGWATRTSGMGTSSAQVIIQGGNSRYQRTDLSIGLVGTAENIVSTFSGTGFTVTGASPDVYAYAALGGIQARAGVLTQPSSTGIQEIVTGINNRVVFLSCVGAPASEAVRTDLAEWSYGTMDQSRQNCYWTAEDVSGNGTPIHGTRYLSNGDVILSAVPNHGSTVFLARASSGGFSAENSSFLLNWTVSDAGAREVIWLALGDEPAPPPPPVPGGPDIPLHTIRRLRRSPHINEERIRLFCKRLEFDFQRGIGTTDDIPGIQRYQSPVVMLRISVDGGKTWSSEEEMGTGAVGDYLARTYAVLCGSGDDFVIEISVSDPVVGWSLVNAYGTFQKGLS